MLGEQERLHSFPDDEHWFESWWFAFYVPERRLSVYVYPWFRPGIGVAGGGVFAWDDSGSLPWTMVHNDYQWSRSFGGEASILEDNRLVMPQGVTVDVLEEARRYRLSYDHPRLAFEVEFEAVAEPFANSAATGELGVFKGHIDQPGRYHGWLRVGKERYPVDCHCVRDRSWGPRRNDVLDMHIGYFHATASGRDAFLMVMGGGEDPDRFTLLNGYLIRDGVRAALVSGSAHMRRGHDLAPANCSIEAVDELGRVLGAEGHAIACMAAQVQPGMFNWSSLTRWNFGSAMAYGELQDTWHPDGYRDFARSRMPNP